MIPVCKRHFVRLFRIVYAVRHNRGAVRIVRSKKLNGNVIRSLNHTLLLNRNGIMGTVGILIKSVVLLTQTGIKQQSCLYGNGGSVPVGNIDTDCHHTRLICLLIGKSNGLGHGQAVYRPNCLNTVSCRRFAYLNITAAGIISAKEVFFDIRSLSDTEREKGSVILPVMIEQLFVVVRLLQAVALYGFDRKSAVLARNRHAYIRI